MAGDSPATFDDRSYLLGGDVIVSIDGVRLTSADQVLSVVGRHRAGDVIPVRLVRDNRLMTVKVTFAALP